MFGNRKKRCEEMEKRMEDAAKEIVLLEKRIAALEESEKVRAAVAHEREEAEKRMQKQLENFYGYDGSEQTGEL